MKIVGIGGFVYPYSTLVHDSRLIQLFIHGQRLSKKFRSIWVWKYLKIGNAKKIKALITFRRNMNSLNYTNYDLRGKDK